MTAYRAYRLDKHNKIRSAAWVEAPNDAEAKEQASDLCDDTTPTIELWEATRLVDAIDCEPDGK